MVNEAFQKNVCAHCRGEIIEGAIRYLDYHREARKWLKTRLGVIITILLFPVLVPYLVWQEIEDATRCPHCYRKIKQWFKTRLGIIIIILLFPILVPYLVWKETKWNKGIKFAITVACLIIFGISLQNSHPYLETEGLENVVQETNSQSIGTEVSEEIITKPASNVSATQEGREKKIERQFSIWDGSHRGLTKVIKNSMNDPESYKHVETRHWIMDDHIIVSTTFRGTNAFGGTVANTVKAKVSLDGEVLEILEQI